MGPTYLVLLVAKGATVAVVAYEGTDEQLARATFETHRDTIAEKGIYPATVYLTTVRAEAKLS